jgi:hypothetical protein
VSSSQINLSWTDNSNNETGFKVERSRNGWAFTQIAMRGTNVTTYANIGLAASTTYHYRVRAYNGGGNSDYSNVASATTLPNPTPTPTPTPTPALSGLTYNGGTPFVNGTNLIQGTIYTVTADANMYTQSVVFNRNGVNVKTDSRIPFDFTWSPGRIGTHTFVATPWSSTGGTGTTGPSITVNFSVVAASPTPTPTPTATP